MGKEKGFDSNYEDRIRKADKAEERREAARDYSVFIPKMTREEVDKLNLGYTLGDWVTHKLDWPWGGGKVVQVSNEYGEIHVHIKCPEEPGIMIFYPPDRLVKTTKPAKDKQK